jgi:hypothetical protein
MGIDKQKAIVTMSLADYEQLTFDLAYYEKHLKNLTKCLKELFPEPEYIDIDPNNPDCEEFIIKYKVDEEKLKKFLTEFIAGEYEDDKKDTEVLIV